jgi:hypothetical protein
MGLTGERKQGNRVRESHLQFYKNDINSKKKKIKIALEIK